MAAAAAAAAAGCGLFGARRGRRRPALRLVARRKIRPQTANLDARAAFAVGRLARRCAGSIAAGSLRRAHCAISAASEQHRSNAGSLLRRQGGGRALRHRRDAAARQVEGAAQVEGEGRRAGVDDVGAALGAALDRVGPAGPRGHGVDRRGQPPEVPARGRRRARSARTSSSRCARRSRRCATRCRGRRRRSRAATRRSLRRRRSSARRRRGRLRQARDDGGPEARVSLTQMASDANDEILGMESAEPAGRQPRRHVGRSSASARSSSRSSSPSLWALPQPAAAAGGGCVRSRRLRRRRRAARARVGGGG